MFLSKKNSATKKAMAGGWARWYRCRAEPARSLLRLYRRQRLSSTLPNRPCKHCPQPAPSPLRRCQKALADHIGGLTRCRSDSSGTCYEGRALLPLAKHPQARPRSLPRSYNRKLVYHRPPGRATHCAPS